MSSSPEDFSHWPFLFRQLNNAGHIENYDAFLETVIAHGQFTGQLDREGKRGSFQLEYLLEKVKRFCTDDIENNRFSRCKLPFPCGAWEVSSPATRETATEKSGRNETGAAGEPEQHGESTAYRGGEGEEEAHPNAKEGLGQSGSRRTVQSNRNDAPEVEEREEDDAHLAQNKEVHTKKRKNRLKISDVTQMFESKEVKFRHSFVDNHSLMVQGPEVMANATPRNVNGEPAAHELRLCDTSLQLVARHSELSQIDSVLRNWYTGVQVKLLEEALFEHFRAKLGDQALPGTVVEWFQPKFNTLIHRELLTHYGVDSIRELKEKLGVDQSKPIMTCWHNDLKIYAYVVKVWPLILMVDMTPSDCYKFAWSLFTGFTNLANLCRSKQDFEEKFTPSFIQAIVKLTNGIKREPIGDRARWVKFQVDDEDDLRLHFSVSSEKVRLPAVDGGEGGKQGPPIASTWLNIFKLHGYTEARILLEYGKDRFERTIGHVVFAKPEHINDETKWLHVHKVLVALGAVFVYPLGLVGTSADEVTELWELQGNAQRRSKAIREAVKVEHRDEYAALLFLCFNGKHTVEDEENFINFCVMKTQWIKFNQFIVNGPVSRVAPCIPLLGCVGALTDSECLDKWFLKKFAYTVWLPTEYKKLDGTFGLWEHPAIWYKDFPYQWWPRGQDLLVMQRIGFPFLVKLQDKKIVRCLRLKMSKAFKGMRSNKKTKKHVRHEGRHLRFPQ
jgi:hypothetical protein